MSSLHLGHRPDPTHCTPRVYPSTHVAMLLYTVNQTIPPPLYPHPHPHPLLPTKLPSTAHLPDPNPPLNPNRKVKKNVH